MRPLEAAFLVLVVTAAACRQDMHDQPKYKPLRPSAFFADGRASRPLVEGTVARGHLDDDSGFLTGKAAGVYLTSLPVALSPELAQRGRERYDVYCSPCHDRTGSGNGMIVQRGFKRPPSLHEERLRQMPPGYFFEAVTQGFGVMPSYAAQIPPADRWAIVAYLGALQLSQYAALADVPPEQRGALEGSRK
jgi:mono/diheme cytochrome c family protein